MTIVRGSRGGSQRWRLLQATVAFVATVVALGAMPPAVTPPLPPAEVTGVTSLTVSGGDVDAATSAGVPRAELPTTELPMTFERNEGQTDRRVLFYARAPGYTVFLTRRAAVLSLPVAGHGARAAVALRTLRLTPVGAREDATVRGVGIQRSTSNYLLGDDRSRWRRGVPSFAAVRYDDVYPGIDLVYHARRGNLEYDFVVAPGADPRSIAMALKGAAKLSIGPAGDLVVRSDDTKLRFDRPHVYQRAERGRRIVQSRYLLEGRRSVGFRLGRYDATKRLVIDPELVYSTYLGGASGVDNVSGLPPDRATGIAVGADGSAYVTGETWSVSFPTKNAYQSEIDCVPPPPESGISLRRCTDAFVAKLSPDGSELVYATYLGGGTGGRWNFAQDFGYAIRVDGAGSAYVTGETRSDDFPTTAGVVKTSPRSCFGNQLGCDLDAFVSKLSPDGSNLVYSTYLGGSGGDQGYDLELDPAGNAHVFGATCSGDFPTSTAPLQPFQADQGGCDGFVSKLNTSGSALVYSTYLGGSADDGAVGGAVDARSGGIAVDSSGNAVVTSTTSSNDFPTSARVQRVPFQPDYSGIGDAFVTKVSTDGSSIIYSTYLGGTGSDSGLDIDLDQTGNAYVTGRTKSTDFPRKDAFDATCGSDAQCGSNPFGARYDAFVSKLDPGGSQLLYSTYLGGTLTENHTSDSEPVGGIVSGEAGTVYVTGGTSSDDFPVLDPVAQRSFGDDAFLVQLDTTRAGTGSLVFSSLLGGVDHDFGDGIAFSVGAVYVAGGTESFDLPLIRPFQAENLQHPSRGRSGFVAKIAPVDPAAPLITAITPDGGALPGGTSVKITGRNLDRVDGVRFGDEPALFTLEPDGGITALSPPHAAGSPAIRAERPSGVSPANPIARFTIGEGLFRFSGGPAAVVSTPTLTGLTNGKVLLVGGEKSYLYNPLTGTWAATTGSPALGRTQHAVSLLPDGKVLAVGGVPADTAEVFDPDTGVWSPVAPPTARHADHTATLLRDGRVLVVGDFIPDSGQVADLYLPSAPGGGAWVRSAPLVVPRSHHTATLLENGKVLIAGGTVAGETRSTKSAVIFDPAPPLGNWEGNDASEAGMKEARTRHTATLLPDGRVLVVGGLDGSIALNTAEIYDPDTNEWTLVGKMASRRADHTATLLPNGKVLIAGGSVNGSLLRTAELFDPALSERRGAFRSAGLMSSRKSAGAAILISSDPRSFFARPETCATACGQVLQVGDDTTISSELYTPAPSITGLNPTGGAKAGGRAVTITGTGFTHDLRQVRFGEAVVTCPSTSCTIEGYDELTVTSPAHAPGIVDAVVTNEGGYSAVTGATRFTYLASPAEVGDLDAQGLSGSEVKLTFTAPPALGSDQHPQQPAQRYVIKQSTQPVTAANFGSAPSLCRGVCSFDPPITSVGDRVSLSVTGLAPATTYHYALKVVDESGSLGPLSNPASATTATVTPGAVTDLTAQAVSEQQIELSFSAVGSDGSQPPPVGDYVIKQSSSPIGDERAFEAARSLCPEACRFSPAAVGDKLTLTVTDLDPATTYHYAVRAIDPHGNLGPRSNPASATTTGTPPGDGSPLASVTRSVTLKLTGHLVATGRLRAAGASAACAGKVRVTITRNGRAIRTLMTTAQGRYRLRLIDRPGRYRAVAEKVTIAGNLCLRARSRPLEHRHRG